MDTAAKFQEAAKRGAEEKHLFSMMHRIWQENFTEDINNLMEYWKAVMGVKGYEFKKWEDLFEDQMEICLERFGQDGVENMFKEYIHSSHNYHVLNSFIETCKLYIGKKK